MNLHLPLISVSEKAGISRQELRLMRQNILTKNLSCLLNLFSNLSVCRLILAYISMYLIAVLVISFDIKLIKTY